MPHSTSSSTLVALLQQIQDCTSPADVSRLKQESKGWLQRIQQAKQFDDTALDHGHTASKSTYDQWVLELFQATDTATPVESLLKGFADRFAAVHDLVPGRGPWLLTWTGYPPQGEAGWYFELTAHAGLTPQQVRTYQSPERIDWLSRNRLLQQAFDPSAETIDLWYLPYYREDIEEGLFDPLFGARQQGKKALSGNGFVTAWPLLDDNGRVGHVVMLLYPNKAALYDVRQRPPGSGQDMRALHILAPVYRQLSALNKHLADDVMRIKQNVMAQIGMGLMHHEVGGMVHVLRLSLQEQVKWVQTIRERFDEFPEEFELLFRSLELACDHAQHLYAVTDAVNRLDKAGSVDDFELQEVFTQVSSLTHVRQGRIGVELEIQPTSLKVRNDATLLLQALLNLVMNALNAFEEADFYDASVSQMHKTPRLIRLRAWADDESRGPMVYIEVANTGPAIPLDFQARLFQRGATTRSQGHGQGLYLVRRIAQYCGGDAILVTAMPPENVCFRLSIHRLHQAKLQLSAPSPT